jgi:hypothetical protein
MVYLPKHSVSRYYYTFKLEEDGSAYDLYKSAILSVFPSVHMCILR